MERRMPLAELLRVLDALVSAGCRHWLEGGWGIDALAGSQTREHHDADIDVDAADLGEVIKTLEALGYAETLDERPTRIEFQTPAGMCVDVHPLHFQPSGDAWQHAPDGATWSFRREWFTTGRLSQREVPCFSVAAQSYFHTGYEPRAVDVQDLVTLDAVKRR